MNQRFSDEDHIEHWFGSGASSLEVTGCSGELVTSWTPKVCKIMTFMATIMCLGLLFYILLGFRRSLNQSSTRWRRQREKLSQTPLGLWSCLLRFRVV